MNPTLKDRVIRQIQREHPFDDIQAEWHLQHLSPDELLRYVSYEIEGILLELEARIVSRFTAPGGD